MPHGVVLDEVSVSENDKSLLGKVSWAVAENGGYEVLSWLHQKVIVEGLNFSKEPVQFLFVMKH